MAKSPHPDPVSDLGSPIQADDARPPRSRIRQTIFERAVSAVARLNLPDTGAFEGCDIAEPVRRMKAGLKDSGPTEFARVQSLVRVLEYGPVFLGFGRTRFSRMDRGTAAAYLERFYSTSPLVEREVRRIRSSLLREYFDQPDVLDVIGVDLAGHREARRQQRGDHLVTDAPSDRSEEARPRAVEGRRER